MVIIMKKRIGVIFGGRSSEHQVSLMSARSIISVISTELYEIERIGITQEGLWVIGEDAQRLLNGETVTPDKAVYIPATPNKDSLLLVSGTFTPTNLYNTRGNDKPVIIRILQRMDVLFPVLHGPYGEDGTIQGLFEMSGLPYVGAGVAASAIGMDKVLMKDIFMVHRLPVAPYLHFLRSEWRTIKPQIISRIEQELGYPCFVKPANTGSSIGITKVHSPGELEGAVDYAAEFDRKLIAEKAISCREIECSVLGNDEPIASIPGEIIPSREFYNYEAKYIDEGSKLLIPAPISEDITRQVQKLALSAYRAIDCAGMARADFFLDKETNDVYLNELNTIPGFTKISMYPKLWESTGIPYKNLVQRLIELAFERYTDRLHCRTTYTARP